MSMKVQLMPSSTHHAADWSWCIFPFRGWWGRKKEKKKQEERKKHWKDVEQKVIVLEARQKDIKEQCAEYMQTMQEMDPVKDRDEMKYMHDQYVILMNRKKSTDQTLLTFKKQVAKSHDMHMIKENVELLTSLNKSLKDVIESIDTTVMEDVKEDMSENDQSVEETSTLMTEIHDQSNSLHQEENDENFEIFLKGMQEKRAEKMDAQFLDIQSGAKSPTKLSASIAKDKKRTESEPKPKQKALDMVDW